MQIENCEIEKIKIFISKYYLKNSQIYISNLNENKKSIKFAISGQIMKIVDRTESEFWIRIKKYKKFIEIHTILIFKFFFNVVKFIILTKKFNKNYENNYKIQFKLINLSVDCKICLCYNFEKYKILNCDNLRIYISENDRKISSFVFKKFNINDYN